MLINAEVWHPIVENDIKPLKKADKFLLRKILEAPSKTCVELLYLETGAIPISHIIKCRRIIYLYYILNTKQDEMLPRVFNAQLRNPRKGDWCTIVMKDLEDFKITWTFEKIGKTSELNFKKKIVDACKVYSFNELIKEMKRKNI